MAAKNGKAYLDMNQTLEMDSWEPPVQTTGHN